MVNGFCCDCALRLAKTSTRPLRFWILTRKHRFLQILKYSFFSEQFHSAMARKRKAICRKTVADVSVQDEEPMRGEYGPHVTWGAQATSITSKRHCDVRFILCEC